MGPPMNIFRLVLLLSLVGVGGYLSSFIPGVGIFFAGLFYIVLGTIVLAMFFGLVEVLWGRVSRSANDMYRESLPRE